MQYSGGELLSLLRSGTPAHYEDARADAADRIARATAAAEQRATTLVSPRTADVEAGAASATTCVADVTAAVSDRDDAGLSETPSEAARASTSEPVVTDLGKSSLVAADEVACSASAADRGRNAEVDDDAEGTS